jgi:hypothetical protein
LIAHCDLNNRAKTQNKVARQATDFMTLPFTAPFLQIASPPQVQARAGFGERLFYRKLAFNLLLQDPRFDQNLEKRNI